MKNQKTVFGDKKAQGFALRNKSELLIVGTTVISLNLLSMPVDAATCGDASTSTTTCSLGTFDPTVNDNLAGAAVVSDGSTITLNSTGSSVASGDSGEGVPGSHSTAAYSIADLVNDKDLANQFSVLLGETTTSNGVTIYTPTDVKKDDWSSNTVNMFNPVGNNQYVNTRFGTVSNGELDIDLSTIPSMTMAAKQSALAYADGTTGNASTVVWKSSNSINVYAFSQDIGTSHAANVNVTTFNAATVNVTDSSGTTTYTFDPADNAASLTQLQNLITQLNSLVASGDLTQTQYNDYINQAITTTSETVTYYLKTLTQSASDEIATNSGNMQIMSAVGANATAILASGATLSHHLEGAGTGTAVDNTNAAISAKDGATAEIQQGGILTGDFTGFV